MKGDDLRKAAMDVKL